MEMEPQMSLLSVTLEESLELGVTWTAKAGARGLWLRAPRHYFCFLKEQTEVQTG